MPSKSPPWLREEIVLALDHYVRDGRRVPEPSEPAILLLSHHLHQLPLIPFEQRAPNFRNPSGVVLKIANLQHFDPHAHQKGMSGGSKLDRALVNEFIDDPRGLTRAAADIRLRFGLGTATAQSRSEERDRLVAEDLAEYDPLDRLRIHLRLEQDMESGTARREEMQVIVCEVCGFDFGRTYGVHGSGYIQFHHRASLQDLTTETRPAPADLHAICANCHAMLHAGDRFLTVAELKQIVRDQQRSSIRNLAYRLGRPPD